MPRRQHGPVEFRKAQVVADRKPDPALGRIGDNDLAPRRDGGGLGEIRAGSETHVEEVDLAVDRFDLAFGADEKAGVVHPVLARNTFRKRASQDAQPMAPGPRTHGTDDVAIETLGTGETQSLAAEVGKVLGQGDEARAQRRRLPDQPLGGSQVDRQIVGRIHLDDGDAHRAGRGRKTPSSSGIPRGRRRYDGSRRRSPCGPSSPSGRRD